MIRVILPAHLKTLAHVTGELSLEVPGPVTQAAVLNALESQYPMLLGTIRDRASGKRRAFVRFYACEEDLSNDPPDTELPDKVVAGQEPMTCDCGAQ